MLPSMEEVSKSACGYGSSGFCVRPSDHGLEGFVAAVGFAKMKTCSKFAKHWAPRLPKKCGGVFVRRSPEGMFWVSVPVLSSAVPEKCLSGSSVSVAGSPPVCRVAVKGGGIWDI